MTFKADATPSTSNQFEAEELLALRKVLTKRLHPDSISDSSQKLLAEQTLTIVNVAYDCIEKNTGWGTTYKVTDEFAIGGKNRQGVFKESKKAKLGTPVEFLNKLFRFLNGTPSIVNKQETGQENSVEELLKKQKENFEIYISIGLKELEARGIFLDISGLDPKEHVYVFIQVREVIQRLINQVVKPANNIQNPKLNFYFKSMPYGTSDEIKINPANSTKSYTLLFDKDYANNMKVLVERINARTL